MLENKNIIVGVCGGIAAYKVADLVSKLTKHKANVEVIMTENATKFISPLTFQTLASNQVYIDMFAEPKHYDVEHVSLAKKADAFIIAPATANVIGKIASGIADDLLTTTIMATRAKVIFAPAMNTNMYLNPIVQKNIEYLKGLGYEFIEPGTGILACKDVGPGRMAEPNDIIDYVISSFYEKDLSGKKVVVTAGPTIEPLDPVRFITNHSSGKMGYNIAKIARNRGAQVVLVSGPTNIEPPKCVKLVKVNTTYEMLKAVESEFDDCDVLIKAAAPSDYRPETVSDVKIKKKDGDESGLNIKFIKNPDIAAYFGKKKKNQIIVGFAAETNNLIEYAIEKLNKKNLDFIVANNVSQPGAGFKGDTNIVTIIDKDGMIKEYPILGKYKVAEIIIDKVKDLLNMKS